MADGRPNPASAYLRPRGQASRGAVLVVDGDRDSADGLVALLRAVGFDGRAAYDGRAALDLARALEPRCVVVDVDSAHIDGLGVAGCLRAQHELTDIVLVGLTSTRAEDARARTTAAGFRGLLTRPVHLGPLLQYLVR